LDGFGGRLSAQLGHERQGEIDSGRDAAAGDQIAVSHNPGLDRRRAEGCEQIA
jgi:hypothetical protein